MADLLKGELGFQITVATSNDSREEEDSYSSYESIDDVKTPLQDADLLFFVNSEWAYKLANVSQTRDIASSDMGNIEDQRFLTMFIEVCLSSELQAKTVSVKFDYISDNHIVRMPFLGPLFNIPMSVEALFKHVQNRLHIPNDCQDETFLDKISDLVSTVNASYIYQSKNKLWLSTKMFYLRNAPSSDDSGVIITRRKKSRTKSIRSRSAETVTCHAQSCKSKTSRAICNTCELRHVSRLRANSCNLSFYPPDSDCDELSLGFSLLETRLVDVNERYAYIINNKLKTEEECLTLDGQSV